MAALLDGHFFPVYCRFAGVIARYIVFLIRYICSIIALFCLQSASGLCGLVMLLGKGF